jgi:adenine-specific DNA methylase
VASLLPAWPDEKEIEDDPGAGKILAALKSEFPNGFEQYQAWFTKAIGILGDPVAGRVAIKEAVAAGTRTASNAYGYERAFAIQASDETLATFHRLAAFTTANAEAPLVVDPFAGGGSIPFEAMRYGCETIANELNPVACAILQGTLVLPSQFGPSFAATIEIWGRRWSERIRKRLESYFPLAEPNERLAYILAHTVPCPTTGLPTPLAPDFWLARGAGGKDVAVRLEVNYPAGTVRSIVVEGDAAAEFGRRSTYKGGAAESIWTGETFPGTYIRQQAEAKSLGYMLLAISSTRPGVRGRKFRAPAPDDLAAIEAAEDEVNRCMSSWQVADLVPDEFIDAVSNYDRGHRMYGIERWSDFFTPRQLLSNVTALEELKKLTHEAALELGDRAAAALTLYLAFALDKMVDYNSRQASWDATRMKIRSTFDKHNFAFKWSFAEFDAAHALCQWAVDNAVANHRKICALLVRQDTIFSPGSFPLARILRGSASQLAVPNASADTVVTDPPYYDNVMYAECSDYFYVWLKRSLADTWPDLTDLILTNKVDEAVANPALFKDITTATGRNAKKQGSGKTAAELADERYEELLTQAFKESYRVLKQDGALTVMFTHKRVDAWDTLGAALLDAGFSINASWPVHTESEHSLHQAKKNAASSTILLACRKRGSSESAYWTDIRRDVEQAAEEAARRFADLGITGVDLTIATYGPVLSVLSERWPVYTGELEPDGSPGLLRPDAALDLARERVAVLKKRGLLGGKDVDFDRVTDWWLLAWSDFQAAEFPFDEARKLSLATHLDVEDLARVHRVIKQGSGTVTLLTPAQRRTTGHLDPDAASWPTWLDRLHSLMLVYDEELLPAARSWLARTGLADEPRFVDLVRAALYAVPRVKDKGEFARPEARILDSLRATLFEQIPAPAEDAAPPIQEPMFQIEGELFKLPGELGYEPDE